jgi:hypothetical protein
MGISTLPIILDFELDINDITKFQTYCNDNGVSVEINNVSQINQYSSYNIDDSIVGFGNGVASLTFIVPFDCSVINFKYGPNYVNRSLQNITCVKRVSSSNVVTAELSAITTIQPSSQSSNVDYTNVEYLSGQNPTKEMSVSNWSKDEKIRFEEREIGVIYIYHVEFIP